jgi:23S rRNA (guanosine2251-2'-O)-methyltransferase
MTDFIVGRNPVLEALRAGRRISRIYLAGNIVNQGVIAEIRRLAQSRSIPVEYQERLELDRQSPGMLNQGVLALVNPREYVDLDDLLAVPAARQEKALLVVLDGIEDPHNLGAIIRTADASGAHGIIIREKRAVGLTAVVEKTSAGAVEYVPVARVANLAQTIEVLKQRGIWVVGVDQQGESGYTQIDYRPPTAVVIGGEGGGIADLVKKRCDFRVRIPMRGKISSLNASVAAAVVLYEVVRQRGAGGPAAL